MDIGLMVEGQNGLTWERWSHIVQMADRLGFHSVFRSDHYFIGPQQDSLDAYLSFVVAARETQRIRFGPLVSPVTFRQPAHIARLAGQIDGASGGRFVMGMGAGWNEPEHRAWGIDFPPLRERFERLEEWLRIMHTLRGEPPVTFEGRYYRLEGVDSRPRPAGDRPPILVGGNGEKRTLKLAARYADEWNGINLTPELLRHKLDVLRGHCDDAGRNFGAIRKSMMNFALIGPTEQALDAATTRVMTMFGIEGMSPAEYREGARTRGNIVGTTDEVVQRLGELADAGLQEVMFQHFNFDSDDVPEYLIRDVAAQFA